jgi:hypothetical protein
MDLLATVALLKAFKDQFCGNLPKNGRSAVDGRAAERFHGSQGDRGVGAVVLRSEEVLTITSMLSVGKIIFYWSKDEEMLPNAVRQCFKFQCRKAGKVATAKPCRFKFQRARGGACWPSPGSACVRIHRWSYLA